MFHFLLYLYMQLHIKRLKVCVNAIDNKDDFVSTENTSIMSFHLILVCVISLVWVTVNTKPHQPKYNVDHHQRLCNEKEINIPESYQVNETQKLCHEKLSINASTALKKTDSRSEQEISNKERFQCIWVCQMQELGLIDEIGNIVEDEIGIFIRDAIPSEEAGQIIKKLRGCTKQFGSKLDTSKNCEKNEPIFQCARIAVREVCKLDGVSYLHAGVDH